MGALAGPRTRRLRSKAHESFDHIWRDGSAVSRDLAYTAASLVMQVPDFHIGFLDAEGCLAFMSKISEVEVMVEKLMSARRNPTLELDDVCMDVLLALFVPAGGGQPLEAIQRSELNGYFQLMQQALLQGAIWPDSAGVFRLTRDFKALISHSIE